MHVIVFLAVGSRDEAHADGDHNLPRGDLGHASCQKKETAETYLGGLVHDAAVMVLAYFVIPSVTPPRARERWQGST